MCIRDRICTGCGRVIDYDDFIDEEIELIKKTERELSKKHGFKIRNHIIQFYGLCKECNVLEEDVYKRQLHTVYLRCF